MKTILALCLAAIGVTALATNASAETVVVKRHHRSHHVYRHHPNRHHHNHVTVVRER